MDNLCMETELKKSAVQLNETKPSVWSPIKHQINFCGNNSPLSLLTPLIALSSIKLYQCDKNSPVS